MHVAMAFCFAFDVTDPSVLRFFGKYPAMDVRPLLQECHGSPIIFDWSSSFKVGRTKRNNRPRCFLDRTAETENSKKVTSKKVKSNSNTLVCMYGNNSTKIHQNKISAHTTYNVEGSKSVYMNC